MGALRWSAERIIATAVDCGPPGIDDQTGAGAVLPPPALTKTVEKSAPNPPYERLDKWLASQGKQSAGDQKSARGLRRQR